MQEKNKYYDNKIIKTLNEQKKIINNLNNLISS